MDKRKTKSLAQQIADLVVAATRDCPLAIDAMTVALCGYITSQRATQDDEELIKATSDHVIAKMRLCIAAQRLLKTEN